MKCYIPWNRQRYFGMKSLCLIVFASFFVQSKFLWRILLGEYTYIIETLNTAWLARKKKERDKKYLQPVPRSGNRSMKEKLNSWPKTAQHHPIPWSQIIINIRAKQTTRTLNNGKPTLQDIVQGLSGRGNKKYKEATLRKISSETSVEWREQWMPSAPHQLGKFRGKDVSCPRAIILVSSRA